IESLVDLAIRNALSGRPGPVHLDIPTDVMFQTGRWSSNLGEYLPGKGRLGPPLSDPLCRPAGDPELVERVARLVEAAKRPVLLLGGGARRSRAKAQIEAFANRYKIPVVTTLMGIGTLRHEHPSLVGAGGWYAGFGAHKALREADVIVALGCKF